MSALYALEQGATVKKSKGKIEVIVSGDVLYSTPLEDLDMVALFGGVQITTQALLAILEKGVNVSFHTKRGQFRGIALSAQSKNITLRYQLFKLADNPQKSLIFARNIVRSKIKNSLYVLQRYHYSANSSYRASREKMLQLEQIIESLDAVDNIDSLRGKEGSAAAIYFSELGCCSNYIEFQKREYFPSKDPFNALLSLGYSMLAKELQSLLHSHGFDPYLGIYHKISYGRASLSLDLVEPFRSFLIDRLVLKCFNKKTLTEDDFIYKEEGCFLQAEKLKKFIVYYEEFMRGGTEDYKRLLAKEVEKLKFAIANNKDFVPFCAGE